MKLRAFQTIMWLNIHSLFLGSELIDMIFLKRRKIHSEMSSQHLATSNTIIMVFLWPSYSMWNILLLWRLFFYDQTILTGRQPYDSHDKEWAFMVCKTITLQTCQWYYHIIFLWSFFVWFSVNHNGWQFLSWWFLILADQPAMDVFL